jgi:hypothetical protein
MAIKFTKDPDAVLDYVLDWSEWLVTGDTISAATSTPDSGITVDSTSHTTTGTTTWLSGGTAGTTYSVVVHVTTADGREDDRTMTIVVKDR